MNWFDWVLIAFFMAGAIITVTNIDRPSMPTTHEEAAFVVVFSILMILGIVFF